MSLILFSGIVFSLYILFGQAIFPTSLADVSGHTVHLQLQQQVMCQNPEPFNLFANYLLRHSFRNTYEYT